MDNYKKGMKNDLKIVHEYYRKSLVKTEQQKMLEQLLLKNNGFINNYEIADIACGGGTLSYHLSEISDKSKFTLIDYMEESISIAKEINKDNEERFTISQGDIYDLQVNDNTFDFTFCWQTLSWLDKPMNALLELIRITKKGGKIYLSSLFNLDHDVDIYSKVYDYTRSSGENNNYMNYNTYSKHTIDKWLRNNVDNFKVHKFETSTPFYYNGKGVGTFTKKCEDEMIQVSAGMLMNWGILEIEK